MNILKNRKAVTVVEVMIAMLLFAIVLAIGYTMLNRTFVSLERQRQSLDTLHEARDFLMIIERDLREMLEVEELDTVFRNTLFDEQNALMYKLVIVVPSRDGKSTQKVTYTYEGPELHADMPNAQKFLYRQVDGGLKKALITKQLKYIKMWGTDGTIFRNKEADESLEAYQKYLGPHYYHPSNPYNNGLRSLEKVKGIEVQLCMHELLDSEKKPIKDRTFVTRIYSRVLNSKYE
ncbi:MAG: prepilin-type N-terminal cleavage/methylation domain-containing protein [Candidatus Riflebacteria bacterium]|nr:prepilin-type N-terminal cleavage/methylation domain-containing protein [Candidatus Riflebacteria bacterium]